MSFGTTVKKVPYPVYNNDKNQDIWLCQREFWTDSQPKYILVSMSIVTQQMRILIQEVTKIVYIILLYVKF